LSSADVAVAAHTVMVTMLVMGSCIDIDIDIRMLFLYALCTCATGIHRTPMYRYPAGGGNCRYVSLCVSIGYVLLQKVCMHAPNVCSHRWHC